MAKSWTEGTLLAAFTQSLGRVGETMTTQP